MEIPAIKELIAGVNAIEHTLMQALDKTERIDLMGMLTLLRYHTNAPVQQLKEYIK